MIKKIFLDINIFLDKFKFLKFVLAGGIATSFDLGILFFLTEVFDIWYLFSAVFSFLVGSMVSFFIQKFWTFKDRVVCSLYRQIFNYLIVMGLSLIIGLSFLYILVNKFNVYYLLAQVFVDGTLAIGRFFINKYIIFKKENCEV